MECQSGDSKKLTKVFDASQRKRLKKKRDGYDDANSVATDENTGVLQTSCRSPSDKISQPDISPAHTSRIEDHIPKRDNNSSPSRTQSPEDVHRSSRSRRKHRRIVKEDVSLALKAGLVSTPRSISPRQDVDFGSESIPQDQDSFIYDFLEEAIKKDKKKRRHSRRREEKRKSVERDPSAPNDRDERDHRHRHHHRHKNDTMTPSKDYDKSISKDSPIGQILDQTALFETFAKICAQMSGKESFNMEPIAAAPRTQSNKSLRCEASSKKEVLDVDRQPVRLNSHSRDTVAERTRSHLNCSGRVRSHEAIGIPTDLHRSNQEKCSCYYDKDIQKCVSKVDMMNRRTRHFDEERYRDYPQLHVVPTRSCIDPYKRPPDRDYRDYEREMRMRHYDEEKRKYCEQKTSRSFDLHREYQDDERFRRSARSDPKEIPTRSTGARDKRYVDDMKYYEFRERSNVCSKDPRWRRNFDRFEKNSVISREDDRERCSERERDSGLSVADGDTSTVSGRSNYLKVVRQQISEQREAMDKMMKLWKELMRCFKGISQTQGQDKNVKESAANAHESAAEQMRLWWECMRRYETVARDVGDTDARLMEEIKKQRSEMAEMATMWQECLQRYRDISNDFNNLKQQLVTPESPPRMPASSPGMLCSEGEGSVPLQSYRMPNAYPTSSVAPTVNGAGLVPGMGGVSGVGSVGPPIAPRYPRGMSPHGHGGPPGPPPPWWWNESMRSPRRRSSPESRTSRASRDREKDRRHRHKDRENSRYSKEKSSKPNAARSEHRHRKR